MPKRPPTRIPHDRYVQSPNLLFSPNPQRPRVCRKRQYPNSHFPSQIISVFNPGQRLRSEHSKLTVLDIEGATPDSALCEALKNKIKHIRTASFNRQIKEDTHTQIKRDTHTQVKRDTHTQVKRDTHTQENTKIQGNSIEIQPNEGALFGVYKYDTKRRDVDLYGRRKKRSITVNCERKICLSTGIHPIKFTHKEIISNRLRPHKLADITVSPKLYKNVRLNTQPCQYGKEIGSICIPSNLLRQYSPTYLS